MEVRGRFTQEDLDSFRIFKNAEPVLRLFRKFFYQEELTNDDLKLLGGIKGNQNLFNALRKILQPVPYWDSPFTENPSRWEDRQYVGLLASEAKPVVLARQDSIRFFEKGLQRLKDFIDGKNPNVRDLAIDLGMSRDYSLATDGETKRAIVAWQDSIPFLEQRLIEIKALAETKTMEELIEKNRKDSTK